RLFLSVRTTRQRGQAQRRAARYPRSRARPRPAADPRHRRRPRRRLPGTGRRPARAGRTCPHRRRPRDHRQLGRRPHGGNRRATITRLKALVMRIVIAEDAAVIRAGLAEILADRGHEVAAAVGDAEALKAAVAEHGPDVAIVDVRMPPDHTDEGLRAAIEIRRDHPDTGILVFSQYVETRYARPAAHVLRRSWLPAQGPGRERR